MPQRPQPPADPFPHSAPGSGRMAPSAQHQSEALDEALAESFPASDSIAVNISRITPEQRSARQVPDCRTRDNIEQ